MGEGPGRSKLKGGMEAPWRSWACSPAVGRTPRSARVPLDPLFEASLFHEQADVGVGCGPGGPPHRRGDL